MYDSEKKLNFYVYVTLAMLTSSHYSTKKTPKDQNEGNAHHKNM